MTAEANTRRAADDRPVVDTIHGPVRGVDNGTIKAWKGIRYAAPAGRRPALAGTRGAPAVVGAGRRRRGWARLPAAHGPEDPDRSRCAAG